MNVSFEVLDDDSRKVVDDETAVAIGYLFRFRDGRGDAISWRWTSDCYHCQERVVTGEPTRIDAVRLLLDHFAECSDASLACGQLPVLQSVPDPMELLSLGRDPA